MDKKLGTKYHQRFTQFLKMVQDEDLIVDGAMTDTKGDRGLAPHQQADPDLFVHVVEKNDKGIVVRGAKAHQTGAVILRCARAGHGGYLFVSIISE